MHDLFFLPKKKSSLEYRIRELCSLFRENNNIPKFIYGINEYALSIIEKCEISGFIDDFREEKEFMGKPILRLEEVPKDSIIISAIVGIIPITIKKRLQKAGFKHLDYFSFCRYSGLKLNRNFLFDFEDFKIDFEKNIEKYEKIFKLLKDKKSKDTFQRLINFRLSYDLTYMDVFEDKRDEQYFEHFVKLSKEEVFLDVGGFNGDTTLQFLEKSPGYKAILLFEPDEKNLTIAKERLEGFRNIYFFNIGLYNRRGYLKFHRDKASGKITDTGEIEIFVDTLDNVLKDSPTFIKMDVEGAEREVIDGAIQTIKKYTPKMAIAAYHRFDDLWAIPEKVLSICDKYSLYLRHYTEGFTETVFYFIIN
ncbi:MAG: FkbM family methyltransferase [Candidatus Omnitrophica bacterium]|nr:FkbM family methyltransferase [Candidatus Omnitrophota bacterium]